MKYFISLLFFCSSSYFSHAAIHKKYKEALQRGYPIEGDSVVLPDGKKCLIYEFNSGECGKAFFDLPYCVPEGGYVWDKNDCCEGLVAYLPPGVDGHATCQKKGKADFSEILRNPMLWIGILALTAVIFGSLLVAKRFMSK